MSVLRAVDGALERWTAFLVARCAKVGRWPPLIDALVLAAALADVVVWSGSRSSTQWVWSAVAVLALLVRRRWPLLAWLATVPELFNGWTVVPSVVTMFTLAERTSRRWILVGAGSTMFIAFGPFATGLQPVDVLVANCVYALFFAVGPIALGLLVRTRAELSQRVRDLASARQREQQQAAAVAVARERAVLAREMHDVVSHQVSLIAVQAGALQVTASDDRAREFARTIRELCVATLDELREMVGVLRTASGLDERQRSRSVLVDLPELVERTGLNVHAQLDLPADLPRPVQRAVYRLVQEALTNVHKHAPGAAVTVRGETAGSDITVAVRNTRAPHPPSPKLPGSGFGIVGLRERAEALGGSLSAGRDASTGGYVVMMRLPLRHER